MADKSYIGKGIVYKDGIDIGNVSVLSLSIDQSDIPLPNYRTGGGGNYNKLTRIDSVGITMTMHDYNAANLAAALFGTSSAVTAAAVTDESITTPASLTDNPLVETANVVDLDQTYSVTSDPVGTTYTEGTDYTMTSAGPLIIDGGGMAASTGYLVNYTKKAVDVVEGVTTTASEVELVFVGLNEAQSNTPVVVKVHRAKFSPTQELSLIGDDFAALELTGECLADTAITTAGLSQYVKIQAA